MNFRFVEVFGKNCAGLWQQRSRDLWAIRAAVASIAIALASLLVASFLT
jgi:hypothetical protein